MNKDAWERLAVWYVRSVALVMKEFTSENVRQLARHDFLRVPANTKQWGRVMQMAQDRGWIKGTDKSRKSMYLTAKGSRRRVWRSLIKIKG